MSNTIQPSVHLGFPNTADLEVSEYLKARGINLLRAEPRDLSLNCVRDFVQIGYDDYIGSLPAFMLSMYLAKPVTLTKTGFTIKFPATHVIPLPTPPVILSFATPIQEVLDNVRGRDGWDVVDYRSGRVSGLLVKDYEWTDLADVMQYKSDRKCPTTDNDTNPSTLPFALMLNKIATSFITLQTYPAAHDQAHYENLSKFYGFENVEMEKSKPFDMDVDDGKKDDDEEEGRFIKIFGDKMKVPAYKKGFAVQYKGDWNKDTTDVAWATTLDEIPKNKGLFVPYVSELANYDTKKVIEIVERRFLTALGEDAEEILDIFEKLKAEWGVLGRTEYGKQLSHLYTCIELAIEGQCICKPFIDVKVYKGCLILGTGFTLFRNGKAFRPVGHDSLRGAVIDAGSNSSILRKIAKAVRMEEEKVEKWVKAVNSIGYLRASAQKWTLSAEERSEVLGMARQLSFNNNSLAINSSSFEIVASYFRDQELDPNNLPIHYTMLFSPNRSHVIWSAFGAMAPSFRIQSGTKLNLTKSWKGKTVTREGGKQETTGNVTRIACNNVVLKKALQDLDEMTDSKEILNPLAKAGAKKSQFNQMRFFDSKDFDRVVASLRVIADAALIDDGRKRKRDIDDEDVEEGSSAKRKGALDLD